MIRAAGIVILLAAPVAAREILLNPPLDCDLETTCFIQQYTDRDEGPGAADFTCGSLSYNDHSGTDFALPGLKMMQAGVNVIAAAPGTVTAARDGMPDLAIGTPTAPDISDRECGNGVVVDHGGGWETQYCHLKQGSIAVAKGVHVAKGSILGQVGLSGNTEFPHVHLSVRRDGRTIDPFHPDEVLICGEPTQDTLWQRPIPYFPGGLINVGFATEVPSFEAIKAGPEPRTSLPAAAPALVLWAHIFGSRAGDVVELRIAGPQGQVIREAVTLEKPQARSFRAAGKRLPATGWPPGAYHGAARLIRDGTEIDRLDLDLTITP